ncbi:MAG: hypothetical protein IJI38_02335 [Clostridia bacterium]|nr:hypothetical protein [Clostridia bacterium]
MMYAYSHETVKPKLRRPARICVNILIAVLLFSLFFVFYMPFMDGEEFMDELDVFILGNEVAHGAEMYKVTVSQHMPFSYYITAVITLLVNPHNPYMYRLCLYILMSALWTGMFFHYKKHINPIALVLLPLIYISELGLYQNGSMMISEHWAGIGHAILLLELLCYAKNRHLRLSNCLWISASILLTFGCVFSSAYSVAFMAVGVFVYQLWLVFIRTPKEQRDSVRKAVIREDGLLLLCVLLPWVILMGWYAVTGNIQNFIFSVYTLNVDIYSKYTGGLGTDAWGTLMAFLPNFVDHTVYFVNAFINGSRSLDTLSSLYQTLGPVIIAICLCFKSPILALAYFFSTISIPIRGFNNFHALHFTCASTLSACLVIAWGIRLPFRHWKNPLSYVACLCGLFLAWIFVWPVVPSALQTPAILGRSGVLHHNTEYQELADAIIDRNEKVHFTDFFTTSMDIDRPIDYGAACSSPWTWEGLGDREMAALKENQTKLVYYEGSYSVWGYERDEYAHELVEYIHENYYPLSQHIFIRRSYLNEAIRRMISTGYETYLEFWEAVPLSETASADKVSLRSLESSGAVCGFTLTPKEDMALELIEFWPSRKDALPFADLTVSVVDQTSGEVLASQTTSGAYFVPDEMNLVYFEGLNILGGSTYEVRFALSGEGDVLLATAKAVETEYASAPIPGALAEGQIVRTAIETADPVYSREEEEEEEAYEEYDESDYENAEYAEEEAASETPDGGLSDPFGDWSDGEEYVEEEEEDDAGAV